MKKFLEKLKAFFINPNGLVLVLANFLLAVLGVRDKGWSFSSFHFYYEPIEVKILIFINFPAVLLASFVYELFFTRPKLGLSSAAIYDFEMFLIVLFSSFQWLLIGLMINFPFRKAQKEIK